ncbi:unnamed protein product [Vicia faba]|uniref:Uncharacterized protein n=1 Tax=Vicia faba TaxID=3906 RepID=A0AAV0ZB78_VICFA|nr:unnamed protein product [Vicia faba]
MHIQGVKKPLFNIAPQAQIKLSNFATLGQQDLTSNCDLGQTKKKLLDLKVILKIKIPRKLLDSKDRLKHKPASIPKLHFKRLLKFWDNSIIQSISKKNIVNRAKQKFMHRVGPKIFEIIREKLCAKENREEVTKAEMFIETLGLTTPGA